MKIRDMIDTLELELCTGENNLDTEVGRGYASDILSDVMAKTTSGDIWVTNQAHENVIAMVFFKRLAGVIIAGNVRPDDEALEKAKKNNVTVFVSKLDAFEIVGRLYQLGVRG
ncbi:serine kinase [candidate division KSB1 bacterium]|nr:serine kinase [candidate division KSB1 bacterium]